MTEAFLEGIVSVRAALESGSRPIHVVYISRDQRDYEAVKLAKAAGTAGIPVERIEREQIDARAGGTTHGGVIAQVGARRYQPLEALVDGVPNPFVVMLDGVEDPYNYGQAIRALYAAGAHGLVVRPRSWETAAGVVARASAGASERIPTAAAETVEAAAAVMHAHGLRVAVAAKERAQSIYQADLTVPLLLIVGGEKRGVTRSFADSADLRLSIPYGRAFAQSLGTTAAAAALAFEIMRQRQVKKQG